MASVTKRRGGNGEQRENGEQQLIDAVKSLLVDGWSYTELSVQTIAEAAGMTRTSFYRYFVDKSQLLLRVTDPVYQTIADEFWPWWFGDQREGASGISAAIERMTVHYRANLDLIRAVVETASYDPELRKAHISRLNEMANGLTVRMEQEQARGQLHPGVNARRTAQILAWMFQGSILQHLDSDEESDDAEYAAAMGRALWLAMYGDAEHPPAPIERG